MLRKQKKNDGFFSKICVPITLQVNGVNVKQVTSFKYLGTKMNEDCNIRQEIHSRIGQAKDAFMCMRNLFTLRLPSVPTNGCESWTIDVVMENELQAFEMYYSIYMAEC